MNNNNNRISGVRVTAFDNNSNRIFDKTISSLHESLFSKEEALDYLYTIIPDLTEVDIVVNFRYENSDSHVQLVKNGSIEVMPDGHGLLIYNKNNNSAVRNLQEGNYFEYSPSDTDIHEEI